MPKANPFAKFNKDKKSKSKDKKGAKAKKSLPPWLMKGKGK